MYQINKILQVCLKLKCVLSLSELLIFFFVRVYVLSLTQVEFDYGMQSLLNAMYITSVLTMAYGFY